MNTSILFRKSAIATIVAAASIGLSACSSNSTTAVNEIDEEPFRDEYANAVDDGDEVLNTMAEPAPEAVAVAKDIDISALVNFDFDSADLRYEEKAKLDALATRFKGYEIKNIAVRIAGYTDAVGPESYNESLSKRRAMAVEKYLSEFNVPVDRWDVDSHGESNPIATNETPSGRQLNRRVEVMIDIVAIEAESISAR